MVAVGDSAGATTVAMLLAAFGDDDPGLIKGAIMESVSVATIRTLDEGQEQYDCLTNATGCAGEADTLACLRGVGAVALQTEECQFNPHLDGDLVKAPTLQRFAEGKYLKVPTIAGTCTDEGTKNVPQDTDTAEAALKVMNDQATQSLSNASLALLRQTYLDVPEPVFPDSGRLWRQLANAHGDFRAHCVTKALQDAMARDGVPTFNYRYGVLDDEQEAAGFGAYHTVELNGVFGPANTDGAPPKSYSTTNAPIVPLTMAYWASFVRALDPNAAAVPGMPAMPAWEPWTVAGARRLLFQNNTGTMEAMPAAQRDNCAMLGPMISFIETPATDAQKASVQLVRGAGSSTAAAADAGMGAGGAMGNNGTSGEGDGGKKGDGEGDGGKKGDGEGDGGKKGAGEGGMESGSPKGGGMGKNGTKHEGGGGGGGGMESGSPKSGGGGMGNNGTKDGGGEGEGGKKGGGKKGGGGGGGEKNGTTPPTFSSATSIGYGFSGVLSAALVVCVGHSLLAW
ncbi:alpha/beta-hydrolase [Colletotrichum falcatum]|nr:alpha/beta-hydrolase [Colletotrichum falcatum]